MSTSASAVPPATEPDARAPSPVERTAQVLRGRFTALVVWHLFWSGKGFYQLVRELPGVPRKALARELEELEAAGIVQKRTVRHGSTRVEYRLSPLGERLKIVVGAMYEWGLLAEHLPPPSRAPR
jgi:DNA-binding HxlR family transcriptional regulator